MAEARIKGGLRKGYTTGTCATAAARAAAELLFSGREGREMTVDLPAGGRATLPVADASLAGGVARCCVIKDAGDDPDVTHGARICASVREIGKGIVLRGGEGIGKVTKPGLQVPVGEPAINPVPRRMILEAVESVLPPGRGAEVTISVPGGGELAKRTMNPRLGIVGGISIIGTTGVVEPMSEEAFKASLIPQIDVALAEGYAEVILTPGRIGERNALKRGIPEDAVVEMSNFVGFMLQECAKKGVKRALLLGHVGKLAKVAAGVFHTHSKVADARLETIAAHAALLGGGREVVEKVLGANTTEEAVALLRERGLEGVFDAIAARASARAMEYVGGAMTVGTVLLTMEGEVLGRDGNARSSRWARYLL